MIKALVVLVFLEPRLHVDGEFRQIFSAGSQTLLGGLWRPPPNMWLSHLGGERSRKRANSLRGVTSRCSSVSSFHISPSLSASQLVPDSNPVTQPPPAPHATSLPTHTHEQMAPELKRATREQHSGHQRQIPQTNMGVRRPPSSVTGSVCFSPVFPSSQLLCSLLGCVPVHPVYLSACLDGQLRLQNLIDLAGIWRAGVPQAAGSNYFPAS